MIYIFHILNFIKEKHELSFYPNSHELKHFQNEDFKTVATE